MKNIYFWLIICLPLISGGCYVENTDAEETSVPGACLQQKQTEINCLPSHPIYGVKAAGKGIGVKIVKTESGSDKFVAHNYFEAVTLNKNGNIINDPGLFPLFKQIDCSGDPYFWYDATGDVDFRFPRLKGRLVDHQNQLYYYKPGQNKVYKTIMLSYFQSDNCTNYNGSGYQALFFKLVPNDPAVTGIETYPFPTPITIDAPQMTIITE